jgi:hypothetical protein
MGEKRSASLDAGPLIKPGENRREILKLFSLTGMILPVYRKPTGRLKIPALLLGC